MFAAGHPRRAFAVIVPVSIVVLALGLAGPAWARLNAPPPDEPEAAGQPVADRPTPPDKQAAGEDEQRGVWGRRPEGWQGGPPRALWQRLSNEEKLRIADFISVHFPAVHAELEDIRESSEDRFERRMRLVAPDMCRLMELMDRDPDRASLMIRERRSDLSLQKTAHAYQQAQTQEERDRLEKRAIELAEEIFDCRIERREMEIRTLELRIKELKSRLDEAKAMREDLVDRAVREHLEDPDAGMKKRRDEMRRFRGERHRRMEVSPGSPPEDDLIDPGDPRPETPPPPGPEHR